MNILKRDQQKLHSKMALFHPLSVYVLFFYIPHSPYRFIPFVELTWSLWNHSFTILQSRHPQRCLQESSMAACVCVRVCVWATEKRAWTRKRFRIHMALKNVPVRLLKICIIWFCWNLYFIEQRGNKDEWENTLTWNPTINESRLSI